MIELKRLGYSVKVEGSGATKAFIASDDGGKVRYTLCEGVPAGDDTSESINISMDKRGAGNRYILSSFLLEDT